jgi:predicted DNA-binding transcriptional regulator AlpA
MSALIDTGQIANMLGVSREHVTDRLTKRPDFPKPEVNISRRLRRWSEADVRAWFAHQSKRAAMSASDSR